MNHYIPNIFYQALEIFLSTWLLNIFYWSLLLLRSFISATNNLISIKEGLCLNPQLFSYLEDLAQERELTAKSWRKPMILPTTLLDRSWGINSSQDQKRPSRLARWWKKEKWFPANLLSKASKKPFSRETAISWFCSMGSLETKTTLMLGTVSWVEIFKSHFSCSLRLVIMRWEEDCWTEEKQVDVWMTTQKSSKRGWSLFMKKLNPFYGTIKDFIEMEEEKCWMSTEKNL